MDAYLIVKNEKYGFDVNNATAASNCITVEDIYRALTELGVTWENPWDETLPCIYGEHNDVFQLVQQLHDEGIDDIVVTNEDGEPVDEDGYTQRELDEMAQEARREERELHAEIDRWLAR